MIDIATLPAKLVMRSTNATLVVFEYGPTLWRLMWVNPFRLPPCGLCAAPIAGYAVVCANMIGDDWGVPVCRHCWPLSFGTDRVCSVAPDKTGSVM